MVQVQELVRRSHLLGTLRNSLPLFLQISAILSNALIDLRRMVTVRALLSIALILGTLVTFILLHKVFHERMDQKMIQGMYDMSGV